MDITRVFCKACEHQMTCVETDVHVMLIATHGGDYKISGDTFHCSACEHDVTVSTDRMKMEYPSHTYRPVHMDAMGLPYS